jgi:hypothetical protein
LIFFAAAGLPAMAQAGKDNPAVRVDISGACCWAPSWESERPFLSAAGFGAGPGIEVVLPGWIPLRSGISYFSIGQSGMDPYLFSYRAFLGWRLALEAGWRTKLWGSELDLLAGGAVSAYEFTDTSLVGAYCSLLAEFRYFLPLNLGVKGLKLTAGLPFEYMWRGAASSLTAGISVGVSMAIGKGAGK